MIDNDLLRVVSAPNTLSPNNIAMVLQQPVIDIIGDKTTSSIWYELHKNCKLHKRNVLKFGNVFSYTVFLKCVELNAGDELSRVKEVIGQHLYMDRLELEDDEIEPVKVLLRMSGVQFKLTSWKNICNRLSNELDK